MVLKNIVKHIDFDFKNFNYEKSYFRDSVQVEAWKASGHHIDSTIIEVYQNIDINVDSILKQFSQLKNPQVSFHRLTPGRYLPEHKDRYGFYSKKYNIKDIETINRIIVFLEDNKSGHLLIVNDKVYNDWKAGDCVMWAGTTPHSAINLGVEPRYTMQITGWI